MLFNVVYGNVADSLTFLEDLLLLLKRSIEATGRGCVMDARLRMDAVNIVLERFDTAQVEQFRRFRADGGTVIVVATEIPTGTTFNDFSMGTDTRTDTGHYTDRANWKRRFDAFIGCARHATAVWPLVESMCPAYAALLPETRVVHFPHAWVEDPAAEPPLADAQRDIDFFFSGTVTAHREAVLGALAGTGCRLQALRHSTPNFLRRDLIRRSKLTLNIPPTSTWTVPSKGRLHFHLTNRSLIVSPRLSNPSRIAAYAVQVPADSFVAGCLDQLSAGRFTERADQALERFRDEMPADLLIRDVLDRTL